MVGRLFSGPEYSDYAFVGADEVFQSPGFPVSGCITGLEICGSEDFGRVHFFRKDEFYLYSPVFGYREDIDFGKHFPSVQTCAAYQGVVSCFKPCSGSEQSVCRFFIIEVHQDESAVFYPGDTVMDIIARFLDILVRLVFQNDCPIVIRLRLRSLEIHIVFLASGTVAHFAAYFIYPCRDFQAPACGYEEQITRIFV